MTGADRRVDFDAVEWREHAPGLREKRISRGAQTLRLVEHTHEHVEEDWCAKAHAGVLLEGRLVIEFDDAEVAYSPGDAILLAAGDRHRGVVAPGEDALMLLVEPGDSRG